jgi:nitrite reductase/ring-hydroxylating ferredoxin subunit
MDGSVARQRGESGRSGAFMDSVLDRIADMVCLVPVLALAADGQTTAAILALITLVVSVAVSHVRAEAEAAKVALTEGLFQRLERVIALVVGLLIPGMMLPVLLLLAVLGTATVLQRRSCGARRVSEREHVRVGTLAEIPEGEIRAFDLPRPARRGRARRTPSVRVRETCTGQGCSLAEGSFDDRSAQVTCAACDSVFDLETGEPVDGPARDPLPLYSAREVDGWIEVSAAPVS